MNDCTKDVLTFLYSYVTLGGGGYHYLNRGRKTNGLQKIQGKEKENLTSVC